MRAVRRIACSPRKTTRILNEASASLAPNGILSILYTDEHPGGTVSNVGGANPQRSYLWKKGPLALALGAPTDEPPRVAGNVSDPASFPGRYQKTTDKAQQPRRSSAPGRSITHLHFHPKLMGHRKPHRLSVHLRRPWPRRSSTRSVHLPSQ